MIYVECYSDEVLVNSLGVRRKMIKHSFGKSEVCKNLQKTKRCMGLVDEDPLSIQPSYISGLNQLSKDQNIKLLYDKKRQHYLIVLCPTLEEWLLKAVKEAGIDNVEELHKIGSNKSKLKNLEKLIKDTKPKSKMLKSLKDLCSKI
jgi:hypothetical protein